jgi:hypothetical protein
VQKAMKKRNCRHTPVEQEQHELAVKIRKMTDAQISEYIARLRKKNVVPAEIPEMDKVRRQAVEDFISSIHPGHGIGQATIAKLREYAQDAQRIR